MTEMLDEAEQCYKTEFTEAERRDVFRRGTRKLIIESIAVGIAYERRRGLRIRCRNG